MITYIPDDPKNAMAGGKSKVAIGARTFDDDQELQNWLAVFLYQNGNTFDVDSPRTVAFTLTAMALEAKKNERDESTTWPILRNLQNDPRRAGTGDWLQLFDRFFTAVSSVLAVSRCFCVRG